MLAKLHFPGRALLFMAIAIAAAVPAGTARAQTKAIGKLFLAGNASCTASVISSKNIIVTAAHCCWDRTKNTWIGGWSFAPAYNSGNAPYGVFNYADARVPNSWINNGDIPSDVCLIRLQNDEAGHPVTYYTGWLGRAWSQSPVQNMHTFGYPGNIGGANSLESCVAKSSAQPASCGSGVLNMACNMTYGSSGGPWIMNYGAANQVNATVHGYSSQTCTGTFGQDFNGPQFSTNNILMLCNAEGC
jgi:V8-like Glu-specific endopeptidase